MNRLGMVLLALLTLIHGHAQDPIIKVETPNVVVDVIVTDWKGHHVSGLTKDQFKLFEDNVPQEIVSLTPPVGEPASVAKEQTKKDSERAVGATPTPSAAEERMPQRVTLLMDLGDMQFSSVGSACKAAAQYVEKTMSGGNQVSLYWVDYSLHLAVPFTNDKQRVLDALEKLAKQAPTGRLTARDRIHMTQQIDDLFVTIHPETLYGSPAVPGKTVDPMKAPLVWEMNTLRSLLTITNTFQARAVFVALRALAVAYRDLPGRKSIVVFSEGFLHSPDMVPEMQGVIDAANRAGVAFYVIDASGPESRLDADVRQPDIGGHRADPDPAIDGFANALGQDVFDWSTTLTSDVHSDLGNIAHATGGFLVSGTNNLLAAIDRVALDSRDFYTLVYQPTNRHYDGAFRKIKVTLDAGGYRLRFRQGYWGIPPGQEVMMTPAGAQLLYALESNTRKPGFAPDIRAALVPSRDGRFAAPVSVSMPGSQVPFEKSKDRYSAGVTLLLVARNPHGQLVSLYERYGDLKFNKQEWEEFRRQTFNVIGHIPIPSMAAITVQAIIQFSSGAVGVSAQTPLGSDASSADVQLTSLVLSNRVEQADCSTDQTDPLCVKGLRVYLPAHAQFRNADKLTVYFSALGLTPDPRTQQPNLQVKFDLLSSDAVSPLAAERIQAVPGAAPGSLMVLAAFDLKDFKPGRYTLKANVEDTVVRAQSSGGADFSVEK